MPHENRVYLSWRGLPLLYVAEPLGKSVLTLENYTKWYRVQLVMPDGSVQDVESGKILEANDKISIHGWMDHLYHPKLLIQLAKDLDAWTDERALEAAGGRWLREHDGFHELIKLYPELDFTGEND
jgi:hypothetical protein